ncbi:UNVERIFIED_CONTAM: hypothetical protein PYX00_002066 [Menopon gallinae]|uniref:Uncharacterized protein n=1 Tax=Menopon gallinae TaxID=328185 RepID=A0AAW2IGJ8_9NEOP
MDCLQLQPHQLRTQPFHYLINEQAKSLLALQELQNEVGALLEFRDLVMETFPNLRQKMSTSGSHNFSNNQNYCSNTPVQLSASLNSRQWEPGIKVKRKIVNKGESDGSFGRTRSNSHGSKIHSSQPKSSEAISGVQDSGFSTETNSSNKDHVSSTATSVPLHVHADDPFLGRKEDGGHKDPRRSDYDRSDEDLSEDGMVMKVNEAEEELWNLLDVIHTKGTKLREEVETLQLRLVVEEIENQIRERGLSAVRKVEKKAGRRCRSLENFGDGASLSFSLVNSDSFNHDGSVETLFAKKRTRSIELEDVEQIREERNLLLDKLAEMETENVASRIKNSELQNEISALISTKEELQEQLFQAMKQKNELNSRIHDLHLKFVTGDRRSKFARKADKDILSVMTDSESSQTESSSLSRSKSSGDTHNLFKNAKTDLYDGEKLYRINLRKCLGTLDGLVTDPKKLKEYSRVGKPSREVLEAILKERNYVELQRHLLISVAENQALNSRLETSMKSREDLCEQLDKCREENDELRFQLEERNIELEGTRARVRVLERLQLQSKLRPSEAGKPAENFRFLENDHLKSKGFSETEINRAKEIFMENSGKRLDKSEVLKVLHRSVNENSDNGPGEVRGGFDALGKGSNVIPILALPLPELSSNQSSGTESTQALEISSELEADMARVDKNESLKSDKSPYRRRPSKIPLNIQKSPKIPMQKSLTKYSSGNPSLKKSVAGDPPKPKETTTTTTTTTYKKTAATAENGQSSITSRATSRNPSSIRYGSIGRTSSQQSVTSQKSLVGQTRKKCGTTGAHKEDTSLTSNGSVSKTLSLKQTTNFSRQRDTLSRKNQSADSVDSNSGKRTFRRSLRDSFRGRNSSDSSVAKKDGSLSRKDSLQQRRTVSPTVQQKTNSNKSVISDSDTTKSWMR